MQRSFSEVAIRLSPTDNVAIAKDAIEAGTVLRMPEGSSLAVLDSIPVGHKLALREIGAAQAVLRYGYPIGVATDAIKAGGWVHTHNLSVGNLLKEYAFTVVDVLKPKPAQQTFLGYRRADGRVGTRNYVAVISTVNCSAHVVTEIAHAFTPARLAEFPNVDGVIPIVHHTGCSIVPEGLAHRYLQRALANVAHNPNIAGYVVVGLGCEVNQMEGCSDCAPLRAGQMATSDGLGLVIQEQGGFRKTVADGVQALEKILVRANECQRTAQPISELMLALQCGGSDSWSGVTANPLVGLVVDKIVEQGGAAVLSETPEIFGAEQLLLRHVANAPAGQKLIERFQWWNEQSKLLGFSVDNNPTPGNKAGGLTTIFEKSLGAAAKGGNTPLMATYEYAERIASKGLAFMDTPGNDPISVTGQLAGGCNMILFTTGRGTVYGGNIAPCIKVASNHALYERMSDDMDYDAGQTLGGKSLAAAADELLRQVISVASGERTKSEQKGLPETEFVPWQPGPVL